MVAQTAHRRLPRSTGTLNTNFDDESTSTLDINFDGKKAQPSGQQSAYASRDAVKLQHSIVAYSLCMYGHSPFSPGKLQDIIHIVVEALNIALQALREPAALLVNAAH